VTTVSRRSVLLLATLLVLACSARKPEAPIKRYALRGEVVRLEPERRTAVIKHDAIDGWMEPMTMEFPVRDASEFRRLSQGQRIRATVNVQDLDYWLSDIQPAAPTSSPSP
jgi:Cu/Ag efflux protein CusF